MTEQYRGSVKGLPQTQGTIRKYIPQTYLTNGEVEISSDEEEWPVPSKFPVTNYINYIPYVAANQRYKPGPIKEQKYWESVRAGLSNKSASKLEYSDIYQRYKNERTRVNKRNAEKESTVNCKILKDSNG